MDNRTILIKGAEKLEVLLDEYQTEQFLKYLQILLEWNNKINLTAIREPEEIIIKHFIDSMAPVKYLSEKKDMRLLDVGTGAGFPGIPLKIVLPSVNMVLLDSLNKRIKFLQTIIDSLKLKNINTIHGRAEDYGKKIGFREEFDYVLSRAVAGLSTLSELMLPYVKIGGLMIAYKGSNVDDELREAANSIKILGGELEKKIDIYLPFIEERRALLLIRKVKNTPDKYPRKAGIPEKRPIANKSTH